MTIARVDGRPENGRIAPVAAGPGVGAATAATAPTATATATAAAAAAVVVGIGLSSRATALELASLVRDALRDRRATLLAVPDGRAALGAVAEAAALLGLPVTVVSASRIRAVQDRCPTRPCRAALAVAEGAALGALADRGAVLLEPRHKGARATCAVASGTPLPGAVAPA